MKRENWTDDELTDAWIRRYSKERRCVISASHADEDAAAVQQADAETFWAFEALNDRVLENPEHAWQLILRILHLARHDQPVLDNLAAGPLESLLARHGRMAIKWVEDEALRDPEFRELLAGVWKTGIHELIWQRVERARDRGST